MQAGGAAGALAYLRTTSVVERVALVQAASTLNKLEEQNSERRIQKLALALGEVLGTVTVS